ncbi:hypothetical protein AB0D84_21975 [Streptomyces sp. NPDC048193]|uniref:hypothetical protein n=1 Tax=unclassified Streptomyces TaxID=2593676 RepID=UPI00343EA1D8
MPLPIALFGVTALVNLLAVAADLPACEWATKPLLAPLLALHLWRTTGGRHRSVLAGLGLATAGDVALLLDGLPARTSRPCCSASSCPPRPTTSPRGPAGAMRRRGPVMS